VLVACRTWRRRHLPAPRHLALHHPHYSHVGVPAPAHPALPPQHRPYPAQPWGQQTPVAAMMLMMLPLWTRVAARALRGGSTSI
jgi:hypothetical protein